MVEIGEDNECRTLSSMYQQKNNGDINFKFTGFTIFGKVKYLLKKKKKIFL